MSAHTAETLISIVPVQATDQPAAVAVALAVAPEAPERPLTENSCRLISTGLAPVKSRCLAQGFLSQAGTASRVTQG